MTNNASSTVETNSLSMQIDSVGNGVISSRLGNLYALLKIWYGNTQNEFSASTPYITFTTKEGEGDWVNNLIVTHSIFNSSIQYGHSEFSSNGKAHITFPKAFKGQPRVSATVIGQSTNNLVGIKVDNITASGCDVFGSYISSGGTTVSPAQTGWAFEWIAVYNID